MKKVIYSLGTLLLCLVLASCSSGPDYIKSLAEDIEKNGEDWDTEEWTEVLKNAQEKSLEFWESMPSEKEIDEFDDAIDELTDAINGLDRKAQEKVMKARNKKEVKKLVEKVRKAAEKARKKVDKDNDD